MKAIFAVCERIGDGNSPETSWRPHFSGKTWGWGGINVDKYFACNIFDENQAVLDSIAADPRTAFVIPIDVDGTKLGYSDEIEVHPSARGKIIAWCAKTYGREFGDWVATNAKNRRFVAQEIMRKASGVPDVDPLEGFRVCWSE